MSGNDATPGTDPASGTVVVVDDDPLILKILTTVLERGGHTVHTASTAQGAVPVVVQNQPDVVFVDAMLAGQDGPQLCRDIRGEPSLVTQPYLILLTGAPELFDHGEAARAGCDLVMGKPFHVPDLLNTMTTIVHDRRQGTG